MVKCYFLLKNKSDATDEIPVAMVNLAKSRFFIFSDHDGPIIERVSRADIPHNSYIHTLYKLVEYDEIRSLYPEVSEYLSGHKYEGVMDEKHTADN